MVDHLADIRGISRLMHRSLLPRTVPTIEGYDVAAETRFPPHAFGRTLWDAFRLADGRTTFSVLHVRGDGLPPAHALSLVRLLLRTLGSEAEELATLLPRLNESLAEHGPQGFDQFVECGLAVLGEETVEWASAGRMPGGLIVGDRYEELSGHGPALGMMKGFAYGSQLVELKDGGSLLVLSDGSPGLLRGAGDLAASMGRKEAGEVVGALHRAVAKAGDEAPEEVTILFARRR